MATTTRRRAAPKPVPRPRDESSVERLHLALRERAMRYVFRPGARINEQALGRELGVSRAPLREALNRLVAEGLLDFVMNKGFFRKEISVDEVYDLYQVRIALECRAVSLAIQRASDEEIRAVRDDWSGVMAHSAAMSSADLLLADEEFHRRLTALARNKELSAFMEVVSRRTHMARHIDIQQSAWNAKAFDAHAEVLDLIGQRRKEEAMACITGHIDMSLKRAVEITKEMVAEFFLVGSVLPSS
ncbi:GntR family transcriptional regulator [Verminephrobacter eiseniae]|uniref:GntR family transcriptional regulator n=1 Tax=Verminephrobacter eiseniae TaxID=364317 RepID=UPI0022375D0B|nr:GntR family transcriptional regulator [Verminephrobacter eiseniae]MCW5238121.1 GntR family transcriptional regulator [Verminephrobacter eiseniae]